MARLDPLQARELEVELLGLDVVYPNLESTEAHYFAVLAARGELRFVHVDSVHLVLILFLELENGLVSLHILVGDRS